MFATGHKSAESIFLFKLVSCYEKQAMIHVILDTVNGCETTSIDKNTKNLSSTALLSNYHFDSVADHMFELQGVYISVLFDEFEVT